MNAGQDPSPDPGLPAESTEREVPKGSYAAGRRVSLPAGAEPPIVVYINGIAQQEGSDYQLQSGEILFTHQILKEEVGGIRWLAMFLGFFGTYRVDETVDVQFTREGRTELVSDVEILP